MFGTTNKVSCVLCDMREEPKLGPPQHRPCPSRPALGRTMTAGSGGCGEPRDMRTEQAELANGEQTAATPEERERARLPSSSSRPGN